MISVLFVEPDSIYQYMGLDCWDLERDARNFNGKNPVICHPPCAQWSRMRTFSKYDPREKYLALLAVDLVRQNGGVVEHPESSLLFKGDDMPTPGQIDKYGGWILSIDQHWFGHLARKRTYLYFSGLRPGDILPYPLKFEIVQSRVHDLDKKTRILTPYLFAKWLVDNVSQIKK